MMPDNLAPIVDLINGRFDDLKQQLAVVIESNTQRDLAMNAKHAENQKKIEDLQKEFDGFKSFAQGAMWVVGIIGTAIGWAVSHIPWTALNRAS